MQLEVERALAELTGTPLTPDVQHLLPTHHQVATTRKSFLAAVAKHLEAGEATMPIHEALRWATESSEAVASLEESEDLFHLWLEATEDLFIQLAQDGTVLRVRTGRAEQAIEHPDAIVGRHYADVLPPESAAHLTTALDRLAATGTPQQLVLPIPKAAGLRWYDCRLVQAEDGSALLFEHDITDRRFAESRFINLLDVFSALFEVAPGPVIQLDSNRVIEAWNTGAEQLLGWPRDAMIGQPLARIVPEADLPGFIEHTAQVLAGATLHDLTVTTKTRDGHTRSFTLHAYPLINRAGVVRHVVAILRPRTAPKLTLGPIGHALLHSLMGVDGDHRAR